jgi:hypothetical protein
LDIQASGSQAHVINHTGSAVYPTDEDNEHPTYHTEKEMVAWWNQFFGIS